jgi:5'-phosphate synthase pdxT subunit
VLALQGDVAEHVATLRRLGAKTREVKLPQDLEGLDGLIIPGGESTTIGKLLRRYDLLGPVQEAVKRNFPVYGTCAGMILVADEILDAAEDQPSIGGMDIAVRRNAFGRQVDSFETELDMKGFPRGPFHGVFIRAPYIERVGSGVEVLARLADNTPVAARQGRLLVSAFHPELTPDGRMHEYFLGICDQDGHRSEEFPAQGSTHSERSGQMAAS